MVIDTNLPEEVTSFTYVKNHHWIGLGDKEGRTTKLNDNGLMRYECPTCKNFFLTPCNFGDLYCPVCKVVKMSKSWHRMQVCFVPEKESDFQMPPPKEKS